MYILAILSVFILGWCITGLFLKSGDFYEKLGLSFLSGLQCFTLVLFIVNYFFGLRLDLTGSWLVMLVLILVLVPFSLRHLRFQLPVFKLPGSAWQKLFLSILVILAGSSLLVSFWKPVVDWDAVTMFDYRAKIILDTGWIKDTLVRDSIVSYPLLPPFRIFG